MSPALRRTVAIASLAALALLLPGRAAALQVLGHSPAAHALAVERDATITVTFDAPLDAATVGEASVIVRGLTGGIRAANRSVNGATLTVDPLADFPPGEIVTVNLTRALRAQGGSELLNGYTFQFTAGVAGGRLEFVELGRWTTALVPYFIYGGDLDGNGTPDAAVPNENSNNLSIFLNGGDGILDSHVEYATGSVPSSCYGDDLDRDGDLDVVTANIASHNMTVLLNQGGATFTSTNYLGGTTCRQVYGGDFDGDGDTDLVTTGFSDDTINIHLNQGDGTFAPRVPQIVSDGPFPVFVGDMNLDGLPDIVAGFQGTPRQVRVYLNQGGGTFAAGATLAVGSGAWDFFGNDLDGDGDLDLVLAEAHTDRVRIIYGDGAGGFASSITVPAGNFPLAVFAADLDGDGDQDVMASDFGSPPDVRVFENAGGGSFPLAQVLPTQQSGSYAWAHDLDGDGDLDLTVVDELADLIFVFRNQAEPAGLPPGGGAPPSVYRLLDPFPNPTPAGATIRFEAPPGAGPVALGLYEPSGRLVRLIFTGPARDRERIAWDGRDAAGRPVAAGVYFLRLEGDGGRAAARLGVLR